MKKIVPFTKELMFKTKIGEITSIALDNTLTLDGDFVSGEFVVSGTYKLLEESQIEEEFKYNIPVDISIDSKYETKNCSVSIDDFSYEIINEEKLKVNISVMLDDLDIKEDPIEEIEVIKDENERNFDFDLIDIDNNINTEINPKIDADIKDITTKINTNLDSNVDDSKDISLNNTLPEKETNNLEDDLFNNMSSEEEYSIYRVYTVKEDDTIDIICDKFATNKEVLADYNDLNSISVGSKVIIPSQDE